VDTGASGAVASGQGARRGRRDEGRWLLVAVRTAAHLHLGFGSFSEYVERSFGYKPRSTQEKLRVAVPKNEREWLHRGQLMIEGCSAASVRFRHADGSPYGRVVEPRALEARAKTFSALRGLGFRESEVRAVLAQLDGELELAVGTTEQWLRAALDRLMRSPRR
jgi:hypothetical protein